MTTLNLHGKNISSTQLCFYKPELKFNEFLQLQNTDTEYWNKYVEYCERYCIALYQIWEKFQECINTLISNISPSLLSVCPLMGSTTIGSHSKKINLLSWQAKKARPPNSLKKGFPVLLLS